MRSCDLIEVEVSFCCHTELSKVHYCYTRRGAVTSILAKTLLWIVDPSQPSAYFGQVFLGLWWNLMRIL